MPDLALMSIEYGGYISIIKFIVFVVLFFLWLPLVNWVYRDAELVGTREILWTGIVFGAGAAGLIIWLVVPVFAVGLLFYLIAVGATAISYVKHRNARVMDYDRILTVEHIKGLFVDEKKNLDSAKGFVFVTANDNEVPTPEAKTPDFFGFKMAHDLFGDAIRQRAHDVVFSATPESYNVAYYVDGAALKQPAISREQMDYFIRFVKAVADVDQGEKRKPQKGRFRLRGGEVDTQWELTTAGSTAGEQVRLKQIMAQHITTLRETGLTDSQYKQLSAIRELKQGLFIVSGTKKAGVTTTLYSLLRNHDPFIYSVNTLERQPSFELPNITQNVFTLSDTGTTTYASKLQEIVRMGPDIVGVADCADSETAQVAAAAAKDGKIVYVALQAESVIQALGKWLRMVGNRDLAGGTLLGVSNQRLLRKLCDECKQAYEPNKEILRKFNLSADKAKVFCRPGKVQYDKHGKPSTCENCQGTGFFGRMCVFEIIMINDELRKVIRQAKSLSELSSQFRNARMLSLQQQTLRKVLAGRTAINEMVRVFSGPKKRKGKEGEQKT